MKYPVVIEERGASEKGGLRQKRFHQMHLNIGCVKGFKCCEDVKCKPYCSMCSYGKIKINMGLYTVFLPHSKLLCSSQWIKTKFKV